MRGCLGGGSLCPRRSAWCWMGGCAHEAGVTFIMYIMYMQYTQSLCLWRQSQHQPQAACFSSAGGAGVGLVCAHEAGVSSMYIAYIPYAQRMRRRNMRVFMCVHADEGQGWVRGGCSRVCWYPASSEWLSTGSEWLATGSKWLAAGSERAWSAPSGICVVNRVVNRTCSVS